MTDTPSTDPGGEAGSGGPDDQPISHTARPYVRSALANIGPLRLPGAGGPAGADGMGEGAVRASFAELAAADLPGADPAAGGAAELAVYGQNGGDAVDAVDAYHPGATDRAGGPSSLLLRSVVDLREVWLPLLAAAGVRSVALLGTENGSTTSLVVELLRSGGGGRLLVVDPEPGRVPAAGRGLDIDVVREYGTTGLEAHTPTDAYLIDGDANYATVAATLTAVDDAVHEFGRATFPLIIVHDVGWPTGRRDRYQAPDRLTDADLQPHSWDSGVTLDNPDAVPGRGIRGSGDYAWALAEGGPRNGVRTAVEEFVAGHPELRFFTVAPVLGLGVVVDRRAPFATRIAELLAPWVANPLLTRLERNRLELYLRVVAMRDEAMAAARMHQQEWSKLDAERMRLVALDIEKSDRIAELERELTAERAMAAEALGARLDEGRLVAAVRSADSRLRVRLRRGPSRYEQARARFAEEEARRRAQLADPDSARALGPGSAANRLALPAGDGPGAGRGDGRPGAGPSTGGAGGLSDGGLGNGAPGNGAPGNGGLGSGGPGGAGSGGGPSAGRANGPGRDADGRLRGRHRPHHRAGEPDIVAGGPGHQEPALWTPGQSPGDARRGRAARLAPPPLMLPPRPDVPPPGEPDASAVPPGAVLLTPRTPQTTTPAALGSWPSGSFAARSSSSAPAWAEPYPTGEPAGGTSTAGASPLGVAGPAGSAGFAAPFGGGAGAVGPVGTPATVVLPGPADAASGTSRASSLLGPATGAGPSGVVPPVAPIHAGRPIPAGQPIPPGSAVHAAQLDPSADLQGRPAELGAPGQPPLFDRSGVPRLRRRSGAFNGDRHEPRHRAPGRSHNPDRNANPDRNPGPDSTN